MSILSAAIDSARSGEKPERGGTGALRGSTENQQSEQERYTALSLKQKLGGQSILSAAIDSARNGQEAERVTGSLEIPERYLGLGSGSGGFRSYTPRGSGFQKNQDVMGGFLNSEVQRTQSAMRLKGLELENSYGALKKAQESITLIEGNMKALYQSYQANPTDEGYQLYERAYAAYQTALGGYDAAAVDFDPAREEYDPLESAYELATGNYQEYAAKKTQEYNAWRNSIRDTGTIQREMAEVEAPRKGLEMERIDLTKENDALEGEMARARADGNSALVDELRRKQWENMERSQEIERQLARLDEAKETLKEELEWARYFRYQDLTQEKDFQELSRYKSTETGEEPVFNSWSGTYSNTGYGDIAYDVINRNLDAMSKQDLSNIQSGAAFLGLDSSEREQMTNEEIGIFNYLYAKEGKDAAYAYIDYLTSDLNYRQRKQEEEEWAAYAEEKPVEASVFSVLESPLKGLSYIGQIADYAEDGAIDQNAGYNKFSYLNSAIRDQVTEDVEENWGGVGSFAYQTGMSMADFLLSTAVSGGNQGVALAIMGTGAAADGTIRAKDRGLSDDKAFALGTIAGAAEILTEKVSLDALLDTAKMGKGALGYFLKNTIAEGSEEVASDFINLFADIIIAQDESEWRQSIKAYQDIGESEESAFWKAFTDQAINMGLDFLGGAISGAVFSSAAIGIDRASGAIQQRGQRVKTQQQKGQVRQEESDRQEEQPDLREDAEDGITLPTAEELLGQNRETPEAGIYDSGITLPTAEEGGVLPTAEQTEVRKRAARAKTELERSGILAGAREADIQTAQRLSNVLRRSIRFYDGRARSDTSGGAEGYYERSTDTIYVNSRSKNPVAQIIAHELTHSVELAEAYTDLSDLVFERIRQTGGDLEEMRWAKRELYERKGQRLSEERIDREIVAKYVENNLLTDEKSILELTRLNRRLGQKILNWINGILAKIGNANAQEQVFLTRARDAYARALRETQSSFTSEQVQATPKHEGQDMEKTGGQTEETPAREKTKNEEETQTRRDQARDALRKIREEYAAGNITEEEFDAALDAVMEAEGLAGEEMLAYSIDENSERDRQKVLRDIRNILNSGGDVNTLRRYVDTLDGGSRMERDRSGQTDSAAENIVREAHGQDLSVDEFLRQNWERYEYDGAMNEDARAALELERQSGRQYSIDENYERDIDDWESRGRPDGEVFILGSTGDVLQGLGAMEQDIYLRSEKVNTILREHPEMTLEEIRRIPEILDDPVLVLKSRNNVRSQYGNSRLILFGTVWATDGKPVLCSLDLRPVENWLLISDMQKVNSAYAKNTNPVRFLMRSDVLYADKKRTIPLLRDVGFMRPASLLRSGSIGSISYSGQSVNLDGVPFNEVVRTEGQTNTGRQYSMEGEIELPTAEELLERERQSVVDTLPAKARNYLRQKENILLGKVGKALNVPRYAQREYLRDIVREISEEYLRSGKVSGETIDKLFERAYDEGIVADRTFREEYDELWEFLRATHLTISKEDSAGIQDFNDFRRSNFGRLNLSTTGETNIDRVYQELETRWPEFFSEARVSHPADQLLHIADVARAFRVAERTLDEYYGPNADEYRQWARNDFEAAIGEMMGELRTVRRYTDERSPRESLKAQGGEYAAPTTQEEVTALWGRVKEARRAYEKVYARNLLTESDERQLGKLMRGEIALEDLNQESDNVRGIRAVYEVKQEYERLTNAIREWNRSRKESLRQEADRLLETANDWKDKKAGILYSRETMERNIRDIVKDRELAEEIIKTYFTPVHEATANANRLKNDLRSRVRKLELSRKVTAGNQVSEAHAVQLLGEAEDNIRMLEQSRGRLKTRDGKTLEEWRAVVRELWEENTDLDEGKIRAAVAQFRAIYDDLFQKMNEARIRNGYEPVNYRKGYFPHFQPGDGDGILAQFGRALGISTEVTALPTTINGLTHTFRPGIRWFGNALERTGFNTAYDAVEGFDRYIEGVADVIYHTDDIQRLRALATQARYRTSDQGLREQVDRVLADPTVAEQDKQSRIEKIYENGRYTLSNFVVELDEYTNLLANKKSRADRNMEQALGRKMYNLVKAMEGRVAANMVAVNPASWLTNFIPLTQGGAMLDRGQLLKGMWDTLKAYRESDGIVDRSTFLTNRRGSEPLVRTWQQSASATMSKPMEYIDQFVADSLVRARYQQNIDRGLSEDAAMSEADAWVAGVMADRSKGSTPTLFNRSNPITKVFTQFQLEVNNQLSYLFKDMPRDARDKGLRVLAAALIKLFLGAFLYNEVYEYFIGQRPALDPIGILNDTVGDLTGWELPNLVELGTGAVTGELPSFRVEQQSVYDTVTGMGESVAESIPFIGGILGGGRVPISSALPDWENLGRAVLGDSWSEEKRVATIAGELGNPLTYLALPFGGGQLKKIYQGIKAAVQGGKYAVNADGEDVLQYPMYTDTPLEAILNTATAMLFGTTALQTGQDWIESGFQSLGVAQTEVYQGMLEAGVPGKDAYAIIRDLAGAEKTETESKEERERSILREADISGEAKSVVYYGLMASEKERELMDALADRENMGEVVETLMDIKDAGKMTGAAASNAKRDAIANAAISERAQREIYNYTFGTRQDDGTYISSRDDDIAAFQAEGLSFEQFLEAQNQYSQISEEYEEAEQKAVEFSRWVNGQGLTDSQAAVVKESFSYFSQIPKSGGYYDKCVAAGLGDQEAYDLSNALDDLEPEEGKTQVSSLQRYRAVVDAGLDEDQQIAALGELMSESEYGKLKMGYSFDVPPATYVRFKEVLPAFDEDGNGGYTQSEVEAALDGMGGGEIILPTTGGIGGIYMTTAQKATLWQLQNKSWKPENNPFSVSVGQQVYEAMNAED